jgi:rapamycin-insensitive companion of mTOR
MFSRDRLTDTLSGGYLAMLGVLTSDVRGLQMMDRWRMFNMMYHIVDLKQRPDLIKMLLSSFDYTLNGHPRVLLSKALTAGTKEIRIHASNVLRKHAVRPALGSSFGQGIGDSKWAIKLLVTQLYDPEVEVCATAVKILEKACNHKDLLEFIVECRPALDHLGEIGAPLLLRFLSTSIGYHYLDGLDYISNEMDDWFLGRNDSYVDVIEASLKRAFGDPEDQHNRLSVFDDEGDVDSDTHIPPHFYRELTRTQEGCKLLSEKGHFDEFAATIRDYGMQCDDAELVTKVKGCLWAVGNVGSMELGAPFLESCDVVEHIVRIAEGHDLMSLRGTAFFVLGLICRSTHGLEILSEYGWDSNTNPVGASLGFCIPTDLGRFFSLQPWRYRVAASIELPDSQKTEPNGLPALPLRRPRAESFASSVDSESEARQPLAELDPDPMNQRVLELVVDLGNMVLFKRAASELMQIKQQKEAPGFRQPQLFRKVLALLETHHYRLPIRRLVLELFDKTVLRQIVFGDDDEDRSQEDGGASLKAGGGGTSTNLDIISQDDDDESEDEDDVGDDSSNSSGDEQRTERQRSISDPADLVKRMAAIG